MRDTSSTRTQAPGTDPVPAGDPSTTQALDSDRVRTNHTKPDCAADSDHTGAIGTQSNATTAGAGSSASGSDQRRAVATQSNATTAAIDLDHMRAIGTSVAQSRHQQDFAPLPQRPTLTDILMHRLHVPWFGLPIAAAKHGAQCARLAMTAGCDEETILACLLHDVGLGVNRADHGWWGAQLVAPYVSERVSWSIRYHQALRYFADPDTGYAYPEMYVQMFGADYRPPEYIEAAYQEAKHHRWYMAARHITLYDDYSFDRAAPLALEPFLDIIGRHFRQPSEGLGNDNSATAHMWRTIVDPGKPL
jgi:hypothetical protein